MSISIIIPTYRNPEYLDKYKDNIQVLDLGENQGMQQALNLAVMNATNEMIFIVNDDNVFCKDYDLAILDILKDREKTVLTVNQIEPTGPGPSINEDEVTIDGGIFPFAMYKKYYMAVGGFDTTYQSPFICDWDFFLKLDLIDLKFCRTHKAHLYHFGSSATKNGKEGELFKATEGPAADVFMYKWGMPPSLFENNSHRPKGTSIRGINF